MIAIRLAVAGDEKYIGEWMVQPGVLQWQPLTEQREVDESVRIVTSYFPLEAVLIAEKEGVPCGSINLYPSPFRKYKKQSLFMIIVDEKYRGSGVGTALLEAMMRHAKERFGIELLHLEVYDGNPAERLYKRLGFEEYGRHPNFLREGGNYYAKILMQKRL